MSKRLNSLMYDEYKTRYDGLDEFMVVSVRGVSGNDNNYMRGELQKKDINLNVVKNSLACQVLKDMGIEGMESVLVGPSAVIYGGQDIVELAKTIVDWEKKLEKFEIRGGYLGGQILDEAGAKAMSKMASRVELQATVVMLAQSPGRRIAGQIAAPAGNIAGCIKTLIENKEKEEAA